MAYRQTYPNLTELESQLGKYFDQVKKSLMLNDFMPKEGTFDYKFMINKVYLINYMYSFR